MESPEIQEAQRRLEEKRALSKPTESAPIGLDLGPIVKPCKCGGSREVPRGSFWASLEYVYCSACTEKNDREYKEAQAKEREDAAKRHRQEVVASLLKVSGIGERFIGMTFADYAPPCDKSKAALKYCQDYVDNFQVDSGCNVMMIGATGTGKNMLSAIIGQELIKKEIESKHTTAMKLVRKIKESWRDKTETEQEVIDCFVAPALLVIDEIGVQFGSPTEQLFLTEVINDRYEKRRPTVLISNLKLAQITEMIGERAVDRFYEDGSKMLVFDWPSYRRK